MSGGDGLGLLTLSHEKKAVSAASKTDGCLSFWDVDWESSNFSVLRQTTLSFMEIMQIPVAVFCGSSIKEWKVDHWNQLDSILLCLVSIPGTYLLHGPVEHIYIYACQPTHK